MFRYFTIYKPYLTLSQFSREGNHPTLKDLFDLPTDVYPVGRLDADSEGLLLLTNDARLNQRLLHPNHHVPKTYWVQVDGQITPEAMQQLASGVTIKHEGKMHLTLPAKVQPLPNDLVVPDRQPPIRYRAHIPAPWISLTIREGKNRQVRKMTAAVGYPTLRLIRYQLGNITLEGMQPGDLREWNQVELMKALFETK
jgi:23S rRNA pseudouridine2457 synthase